MVRGQTDTLPTPATGAAEEVSTTPMPKSIVLDDDNWCDYFATSIPEEILQGLVVGEGGIDRDGPLVDRLMAHVQALNDQLQDLEYVLSRDDAVRVLNLFAGWPECFW